MIPLYNKELLIKYLQEGYTIIEACQAAQVSKASLYRLFKEQPGFKADVDRALFKAKDVSADIQAQVEARKMEELKGMITKKKSR